FLFLLRRRPPRSTPFPYTTLFRSAREERATSVPLQPALALEIQVRGDARSDHQRDRPRVARQPVKLRHVVEVHSVDAGDQRRRRSEEHTSELQSRENLVCRLLLEK